MRWASCFLKIGTLAVSQIEEIVHSRGTGLVVGLVSRFWHIIIEYTNCFGAGSGLGQQIPFDIKGRGV
jgi:hypothetical protein